MATRASRTLSLVWLLYLGAMGLFFPFYSLYLRENAGLRGFEVGVVVAAVPLVSLLSQPLWGQIADLTGSRTRILALLGLGTALGYASLSLAGGFVALLLTTAGLALFSSALIPTAVSVSFAALRDPDGRAFGRVRVWGTLGFGISVALFPALLERYRAWRGDSLDPDVGEPGLALIFLLASVLVLAGALASLRVPSAGALSLRADRGDWRLLLRHGPFLRLVAIAFLTYLCIQGPMVLFPILVRAQGGGIESISTMWLLMLTLEIPLVYWFGAILARIGPRSVIAIGVLSGGLRWAVSGFSDDLAVVTWVQLLHGVTVWGVVLGCPMYADLVVPERLRSTAQGLLAMVGVSLASIVSNLAAGWLTEHVGAETPARVGGLGCVAIACLLPLLLPKPSKRGYAPSEVAVTQRSSAEALGEGGRAPASRSAESAPE